MHRIYKYMPPIKSWFKKVAFAKGWTKGEPVQHIPMQPLKTHKKWPRGFMTAATRPCTVVAPAPGASCCRWQIRKPQTNKFISLPAPWVQCLCKVSATPGVTCEPWGMLQPVKGFPRVDCVFISPTVNHSAGRGQEGRGCCFLMLWSLLGSSDFN